MLLSKIFERALAMARQHQQHAAYFFFAAAFFTGLTSAGSWASRRAFSIAVFLFRAASSVLMICRAAAEVSSGLRRTVGLTAVFVSFLLVNLYTHFAKLVGRKSDGAHI
jgi:hypothetical protein